MNIHTLQTLHLILAKILGSDVLTTGFGFSIGDLVAMQTQIEIEIKKSSQLGSEAKFFTVGVRVNTREMARRGGYGEIVATNSENIHLGIYVRFTEKDGTHYNCWMFPDENNQYWWNAYQLYIDPRGNTP